MRKILEVLQSSTGELTFNTDVDVEKDATVVMDIMSSSNTGTMFSLSRATCIGIPRSQNTRSKALDNR